MNDLIHLTPLDPRYPSRLRHLPLRPECLTTRGGSLEAERVVAVVGSRRALAFSADFARSLAMTLVRAGVVVVSGGAVGVDAAAHLGALEAGGRTWAVAGTGCEGCLPPQHAPLFERIAAGPGAMIWPFAPPAHKRRGAFLSRNRVLVALADAVVVVQAGDRSGALAAAARAVELGRSLWAVPAAPRLDAKYFTGTHQLLQRGVTPLTDVPAFLASLDLTPSNAAMRSVNPPASKPRPAAETAVLAALRTTPTHTDEVILRSHLDAHEASAALLTLALEAVVVEEPPGFFRRQIIAASEKD